LPDAEVEKKREQEWQPKTAAEELDKKDASGAVPTEESPKRDDADPKPLGTSKHSIYFPKQTDPFPTASCCCFLHHRDLSVCMCF
jgi:hypothetical protein